jgi:hypothetical protein
MFNVEEFSLFLSHFDMLNKAVCAMSERVMQWWFEMLHQMI